jgi:hypothetical protein
VEEKGHDIVKVVFQTKHLHKISESLEIGSFKNLHLKDKGDFWELNSQFGNLFGDKLFGDLFHKRIGLSELLGIESTRNQRPCFASIMLSYFGKLDLAFLAIITLSKIDGPILSFNINVSLLS